MGAYWRGRIAAIGTMLLIGAMGMSGCGGGGRDTTASVPTSSISRAQFVRKAQKLCRGARLAAERKALAVFRSKAKLYERHGDLTEFAGSLRRQEIAIVIGPSLRRRLKEVRELGIPTAEADHVEKILGAIGKAARTEQETFQYGLSSGGGPIRHARTLAAAYGIASCAVPYEHDGLFQKGSANPAVRLTPRSSK